MAEKKRVLVVEDEPHLLDMMVDFCDDIGVTPLTAATGGEGLAKAQAEKPDAILLDNRLPDILGLELIEKLKSLPETKAIPLALLSGDAKTLETQAREKGAQAVLLKPINRASLKKTLESFWGPF